MDLYRIISELVQERDGWRGLLSRWKAFRQQEKLSRGPRPSGEAEIHGQPGP